MNWGRAKTILIVLFLVVDIFFLVLLSYVNHDVRYIKKSTISEVVNVLNSRNIEISEKQIPKKRYTNKTVKIKNMLYNHKWVAERFLGENYDIVAEDENGSAFKKGDITLFVSENDFSLEKQRDLKPVETFDEVVSVLYKDMKKIGYTSKSFGIKDYYIKDGVCHIAAYHMYDGLRIDSSKLIISADKSGIINIGGVCLAQPEESENEGKLPDITSVLVNMIYEPRYVGMKVEKAELVLMPDGKTSDDSQLILNPVYVVTDNYNREYSLN